MCKPGTLFLSFSLGSQPMELGFPLDTLGLGFRATDESWTCPLVGVALLIYDRVGTLRLGSAGPQAKGFRHPQLELWLGQKEPATDAGSKDQHLTLRFKQVL